MKSVLLAAAVPLLSMPTPGVAGAGMPPDPLMQRLVPVPFTAAELAVRSKTEAPGLNLWRLAGELDALTTDQVRTVALNCWRPYRRFETDALYAATLALSLWSERDPADAAGTLIFIGSWEDMDDSIGDYDIDLESTAGWLWAQLAKRDWMKASVLLRRVSGEESTGQFASAAAGLGNFTPSRAAEFIAILAPKPMEKGSLEEIVHEMMRNLVATHGLAATRAWAKSLRPVKAREAALHFILKLDASPPQAPPIPRSFSDDPLGKLRALDLYGGPWIMPFPLYRAVKALPPAEALRLAEEDAAHPLPEGGVWLRWMLFNRAAEGDAAAAAHLACGTQWVGETHALTEAFALRKDIIASLEEIERMTDKPRREFALRGLSYHVDTSNPEQWLATVARLKASAACAEPLFARLGAAGQGREAWELASRLEDHTAGERLARAALRTWIVTNVRGFFTTLVEAERSADPAQRKQFIAMESCVDLLDDLSAHDILLDGDPIPAKYLYWSGHLWTSIAFEEREFTFRYLERHADDPDYGGPISHFADVAVRFEPERAVALQRRALAAQLAATPPSPDGGEPPRRPGIGSISGRLVQFWPEKALAIAAPATDKEWESLCWNMLEQHPQRLASLVKTAPDSVRQFLTKLLTEPDSTGPELKFPAEQRRVIAEALRAAKK